ncbi:serine protease inhibitor dipetalogastin-like [Cydia pomonella]|uniref:serine protease inhibitor dipetalogastin-like n=1 Tax=Cydia pomonella TaxID=82600 RepID=UPI002ADD7515|nr:serine protease inhibitor dipetalogastin-like [Cydia pomonella]
MYKFGILLIASYICSTAALPPCVCARDYTPVCGSDGETYPNSCMLDCAAQTKHDLKLAHGGPCQAEKPSCICTFEYKPVCGMDGTTYPSKCALGCEKSRNPNLVKLHDGPCETETVTEEVKVAKPILPTCTCTRNFEPICGTDGVTYSNMCLLKCAAQNKPLDKKADGPCEDVTVKVVEDSKQEPPKKSCVCFRNYAPVCGSDGKTYANHCVLGCSSNSNPGLSMAHNGPC